MAQSGDDTPPFVIMFWCVLGAAALTAIYKALTKWLSPKIKSLEPNTPPEKNSLSELVAGWWESNWWLVIGWIIAIIGLLIYRSWVRSRARVRHQNHQLVAGAIAPLMPNDWTGQRHLQIRRWRGTRPAKLQLRVSPKTLLTDTEWRIAVTGALKDTLGRIEPITWPKAHDRLARSEKRWPQINITAITPPSFWDRLLKRQTPKPADESAQAKPAKAEEILVQALNGLVPKPVPEVEELEDGLRIVVRYAETTRDMSPAWRSRVVDQASGRLGTDFKATWDRQRRMFTLESVPTLPDPILWAEMYPQFRKLDIGQWVIPYGNFEDGSYVVWKPGNTEPHAMWTGDPGSGKTQTIKSVANGFLLAGGLLAISDPKKSDFAEYLGRPGVICVATAVEDQVGLLRDMSAEMERRNSATALKRVERMWPELAESRPDQAAIDDVPILYISDEQALHVDEVTEWWRSLEKEDKVAWGGSEKSSQPPMLKQPAKIVAVARAIRISYLAGMQRADAGNFGGATTMRDNIKHMSSMGVQSPIGSDQQWGDRRIGSEIVVRNPGEGMSNGYRISRDGKDLGRGVPGRYKAWYSGNVAETEEFWAAVAAVAPDKALINLPTVSDAAKDPAAAARVLREQAYGTPHGPAGPMGRRAQRQGVIAAATVDDVDAQSDESADEVEAAEEGIDPLLRHAAELVIAAQHGSVSMLQRKMRVGYERARQLMENLEELGVVGPANGRKPRIVLFTPDHVAALDEQYGDGIAVVLGAGGHTAELIPAVSAGLSELAAETSTGGVPGQPQSEPDDLDVDLHPAADGIVWEGIAASVAELGDIVQFGDITEAEVISSPEIVVDEIDGSELVRLELDTKEEEITVDLGLEEVIYRQAI